MDGAGSLSFGKRTLSLALSLVLAMSFFFASGSPAYAIDGSGSAEPSSENVFEDVDSGEWYSDYVGWASDNGVMNGYDDGSGDFGIGKGLTRAELAQLIANWAGAETEDVMEDTTGLVDIAGGGQWFTGAANWAFSQGIITGYDEGAGEMAGCFAPDDAVTREMSVTVFYRLSKTLGIDVSNDGSAFASMPDAESVSPWARDAMSWAVDRGIVSGAVHSDGSKWIEPSRGVLREEIAKIVYFTDAATEGAIAGSASSEDEGSEQEPDENPNQPSGEPEDPNDGAGGGSGTPGGGTESGEPGSKPEPEPEPDIDEPAVPDDPSGDAADDLLNYAVYDASDPEAVYGAGAYVEGLSEDIDAAKVSIPATIEGAPVVSVELGNSKLVGLDVSACGDLVFLDCQSNALRTLDVSDNPKLTFLNCSSNYLTSLNVYENTALERLECWYNFISTLDLSSNASLSYLDCSSSQTFRLTLPEGEALQHLDCSGNFLSSLDVTGCAGLASLNCSDNEIKLLDISSCEGLSYLDCRRNNIADPSYLLEWLAVEGHDGGCLPQSYQTSLVKDGFIYDVRFDDAPFGAGAYITGLQRPMGNVAIPASIDGHPVVSASLNNCSIKTIDVSACANLRYLDCSANDLVELDVSNNPKLQELWCHCNLIEGLDLSGSTQLVRLGCSANMIKELDLSACDKLEHLACDLNIMTDTGKIDEWLNEEGHTGYYFPQGVGTTNDGFRYLLGYDGESHWLDFIGYYGDESAVRIPSDVEGIPVRSVSLGGGCSFSSIDASGCNELVGLSLWNGSLESLDVSNCPKLETLSCEYSGTSSLYLLGSQNLVNVYLNGNRLTSLDLSQAAGLKMLRCSDNQLASLDLSGCSELTTLECYDNQLASLDLSGCSKLVELRCYGNQLASLDLSGCSELTTLECSDNQLASLDLSGCSKLATLGCWDNLLSELSIAECPSLTDLQCSNNYLVSLNLTGARSLRSLGCPGNLLESIDLSSCESLTYLECSHNRLTALDFSACPNLSDVYCRENYIEDLSYLENWVEEAHGRYADFGYQLKRPSSEEDFVVERGTESGLEVARIVGYRGISADVVLPVAIDGAPVVEADLDWAEGSDSVRIESLDANQCRYLRTLSCANNRIEQFGSDGVILPETVTYLDCSHNSILDPFVLSRLENWAAEEGHEGVLYPQATDVKEENGISYRIEADASGVFSRIIDYAGDGALMVPWSLGSAEVRVAELENCGLESIDLSDCGALEYLDVSNNELTELDIEPCPNLGTLYCSGNSIASTDALEQWLSEDGHGGMIMPQKDA